MGGTRPEAVSKDKFRDKLHSLLVTKLRFGNTMTIETLFRVKLQRRRGLINQTSTLTNRASSRFPSTFFIPCSIFDIQFLVEASLIYQDGSTDARTRLGISLQAVWLGIMRHPDTEIITSGRRNFRPDASKNRFQCIRMNSY